jgi:ketosteroid isomerase-like protein
MKKIVFLLLVVAGINTSCQNKMKVVPVDLATAKTAVSELLDKYYSALNTRDANTCLSFLTEDVLLCGTDPGEFWNKTDASKVVEQMLADTSMKFNFKIDKREIRISRDGNSAVVVDQMLSNFICPKIPLRIDYHLVKNNDVWQIDFCSDSLIPYNKDLATLNKALE